MTLAEAVHATAARLAGAGIAAAEARNEARLLVARAAALPRESLITRDREPLSIDAAALLADWTDRRAAREPLAYILGERAFYGLTFHVTPAVLVPRPETELLVELALRYLHDRDIPAARVADVGTGSGCIAIAIARNSDAHVWASDLSPDAAAVAQDNARRLAADRIHVRIGDLLAPLTDAAPFDVIVSNPPYIAPQEIETLEPEVRDYEPRLALGTHPDALHFYRRLAREAPALLEPGGLLAVEVGQNQANAVCQLWESVGLSDITTLPDLAGIPRIVRGIKTTAAPPQY